MTSFGPISNSAGWICEIIIVFNQFTEVINDHQMAIIKHYYFVLIIIYLKTMAVWEEISVVNKYLNVPSTHLTSEYF